MGVATKFSHTLLIALTLFLANLLGETATDEIDQTPFIEMGDSCAAGFKDECLKNQIVYRAMTGLVILFAATTLLVSFSPEVDKSFWPLKYAFVFLFMTLTWYGKDGFFNFMAEVARVFSFFWLVVQAILVFDLSFGLHEYINAKVEERERELQSSTPFKVLYLVLSAASLTCTFVGIGYMYSDYADCSFSQFLITVSFLFIVSSTIVSISDRAMVGLLPPCITSAYLTLLCWYALLSYPSTDCNPTAGVSSSKDQTTATVIMSLLSLLILFYCAWNGTKILYIFSPSGHGVITGAEASSTSSLEENLHKKDGDSDEEGQQQQSGDGGRASSSAGSPSSPTEPASERVFFHCLMLLASLFGAMVLTSWSQGDGSPVGLGNDNVDLESMWLKIISQWLFMAMFGRTLYVNVRENA